MKPQIVSTVITLILLATSSAICKTPFPYTKYGIFEYKSEIRHRNGLITNFEKGTIRITKYKKNGTRIIIQSPTSIKQLIFASNGLFRVIAIQDGDTSIQPGRWKKNRGNAVIITKSFNRRSHFTSKGDFGISSKSILFSLQVETGFCFYRATTTK